MTDKTNISNCIWIASVQTWQNRRRDETKPFIVDRIFSMEKNLLPNDFIKMHDDMIESGHDHIKELAEAFHDKTRDVPDSCEFFVKDKYEAIEKFISYDDVYKLSRDVTALFLPEFYSLCKDLRHSKKQKNPK